MKGQSPRRVHPGLDDLHAEGRQHLWLATDFFEPRVHEAASHSGWAGRTLRTVRAGISETRAIPSHHK